MAFISDLLKDIKKKNQKLGLGTAQQVKCLLGKSEDMMIPGSQVNNEMQGLSVPKQLSYEEQGGKDRRITL